MFEFLLRVIKSVHQDLVMYLFWIGSLVLYFLIGLNVTASLPIRILVDFSLVYSMFRLNHSLMLFKYIPWCKYKLGKHSFRPLVSYHERLSKPFKDLPQHVILNKSVICYKCFWAIHRISLASSISVQGLRQQEYLSKLDYYHFNATEKKDI